MAGLPAIWSGLGKCKFRSMFMDSSFLPVWNQGDKAWNCCVKPDAFLFLDAKRPENKLYLFSGPNWVGIHTNKSQASCGLTSSAEKWTLPDCLTFWPSLDRQGIVPSTPSPALPCLLRPKIQTCFTIF